MQENKCLVKKVISKLRNSSYPEGNQAQKEGKKVGMGYYKSQANIKTNHSINLPSNWTLIGKVSRTLTRISSMVRIM
jgi:hypothetical protein